MLFIYLFICSLTTLRRKKVWYVNDALERMRKEAVMA
jgi:hypothetical protein